jgi:hypothetical protein
VSLFNGQYLVSAASLDPYVAICNVVQQDTAQTSAYLANLNSQYGNGAAPETFQLTLAYVTTVANQNQLLAGGQSCVNFFISVQAPLAADLTNDGIQVTDAKQAVLQAIITFFPQMAAYFQ